MSDLEDRYGVCVPEKIASLQGRGVAAMVSSKPQQGRLIVKTVGDISPGRATKDVTSFKRAADAYVQKATASVKSANSAMVALGIQTATGKLTKHYK